MVLGKDYSSLAVVLVLGWSLAQLCSGVFAFVPTWSTKTASTRTLPSSFVTLFESSSSSSSLYHNSTFIMSPRVGGSISSSSLVDTETTMSSLQHFWDTIIELQQGEDASAIQLCQHNNDQDSFGDVSINSIVFRLQTQGKEQANDDAATIPRGFPETTIPPSSSSYVLAVLASADWVNVSRLEQIVVSRLNLEADERRSLLTLASADQVQDLCGFAPGTVPPLGLSPAPVVTVVDQALLRQSRHWMVGGGGTTEQACRFRLDVLLGLEGVVMENIRDERTATSERHQHVESLSTSCTSPVATSSGSTSSTLASVSSSPLCFSNITVKPFFPVETPPMDVAAQVIADATVPNPLVPTELSLVARVARVRRMARRLVFCDLVPPEVTVMDATTDNGNLPSSSAASSSSLKHHWRSPVTGKDMSVQLIAGKTLCQQMGTERGELMLRKGLQVGQLVWIRGKTNVGNRESLRNWVGKQSMDIVAWDCTLLTTISETNDALGLGTPTNTDPVSRGPFLKHSASVLPVRPNGGRNAFVKDQPTLPSGMTYLKLRNIFSDQYKVVVVDSIEKVREFRQDVTNLMKSDQDQPELTGLDCEWKPNFLLHGKNEAQPVLLLQVSLNSIEKVYLFDLQTLLRPLLDPSEPRTTVEDEMSEAFNVFFQSSHFVKVGFQLITDLRRLAASYPNISGFAHVEAVLELSRFAKKSMYLSHQPNSRTVTSSLRNMVHHFLQYGLDKTEQISDWSQRPLSDTQMEYAALDAAATPKLLERLMDPIQARVFARPSIQIGRWLDDTAFSTVIQSWRFLFVDPANNVAIRRLQAKATVGDNVHIVSQSWRTGSIRPPEPSVPTEDGPYIDAGGVFRIPAKLVELQPLVRQINQVIDRFLGERVAKTKDRCVAVMMQAVPSISVQLDEGARIDFPQRSGYVEFADAAILFVNMPLNPWARKPRSYPNEWLNDGQVLTWFLRESEWRRGSTPLARKLLSPEQPVYLFVRLGKGHFLCCGRCRVSTDDGRGEVGNKRNWDLIKLSLTMLDWKDLNVSPAFLEMVHPGKYKYDDLCTPPDTHRSSDNDGTDEDDIDFD